MNGWNRANQHPLTQINQLFKSKIQRLFLVVSITFHSIADICRAFSADSPSSEARRNGMLDQVAGAIAALLSAPARS